MAHKVKCIICGKVFDTNTEPFLLVSNGTRYVHINCKQQQELVAAREEQEKEELENYIKQLFHFTSLPPRILKQIEVFVKENKYSYSAIRKTLIYFFEIKHNDLDKANNSIGIVPYVIDEAKKYWQEIKNAQDKNKELNIEDYIPIDININMIPQKRIPMVHRKKLFSFLEEEG